MRRYRMMAMLLAAGVALYAAGCKQPRVEEAAPEPPAPVVPEQMRGEAEPLVPAPQRAILDSEVGTKWKAVEVTVTEKKEDGGTGATYVVEIPLQGEAPIEGTPLKIRLLGFVPDFAMGADSITTKSLEDVNPAAKIEISEGGKVLFAGWSFRDHPDMHSFEDPRYNIQLTKAVPK